MSEEMGFPPGYDDPEFKERLSYIANICQVADFLATLVAVDNTEILKEVQNLNTVIQQDNDRILHQILDDITKLQNELVEIKSMLTNSNK